MASLNTIKNWFKTGLKPTQQQFWDTWDSFWHKDDAISVANIDGIDNLLNQKANKSVVDAHLTDTNAHKDLFTSKEDKSQKGQAGGYVPLSETGKIVAEYLEIVDDLVQGGRASLLSAEQGLLLQNQINQINVLLKSDNVNLDNIQELVDAIETLQLSLSTILVNNLSTGGITKALTAEQGKVLKGLIDAKASATDVSSLLSRVTAVENGKASATDVISLLSRVTAVENGKASATDVSSLLSRVTAVENGKASATDVNSLLSRVTAVENGKASATDVNSLLSRVTAIESKLSTNNLSPILHRGTYNIGDLLTTDMAYNISIPDLGTANYIVAGSLYTTQWTNLDREDDVIWTIAQKTSTSFTVILREVTGETQHLQFDYIIVAK